jgi:tetratricopeptide (TPR) repeat protein
MEKGSWQQAIAAFEKAAADQALRAESYRMIGRCHMGTGNVQIATVKYKVGLMARRITTEQEINLCADLSEAYIKAGNFTQSLQYLKKILAINPAYPQIREKIAAVEARFRKPYAR